MGSGEQMCILGEIVLHIRLGILNGKPIWSAVVPSQNPGPMWPHGSSSMGNSTWNSIHCGASSGNTITADGTLWMEDSQNTDQSTIDSIEQLMNILEFDAIFTVCDGVHFDVLLGIDVMEEQG